MSLAADSVDGDIAALIEQQITVIADVWAIERFAVAATSGQPPQVTIAVLQVVEILDAGTATYVDVAPFIRSQVQEQRAREQVIESLRSKAHVEVRR